MSQFTKAIYLHSAPTHNQAKIIHSVQHRLSTFSSTYSWLDTSWLIKDLDTTLRKVHWTRELYRTVKVSSLFLAIVTTICIILLSGIQPLSIFSLVALLVALVAGWVLPDQYILDAVTTKQMKIRAQVPEFLQLFALCVASSGYTSVIQVLEDVSMALTGSLKKEVNHLLHKKQYLTTEEILQEITQLTPHPFLQDLVMILEIHQSFGGQLSTTLMDLSRRAQTDRVQLAQELANSSSGLLLGPLLLFHLPALLIIVLIPAVIAFTNGL